MDELEQSEKPDREVKIREFRGKLASLINEVTKDGTVVYLTRRGERVAALVGPSFENRTGDSVEPAKSPGSVRRATQLIESMLTDDVELLPDPSRVLWKYKGEVVGELAVLALFLYHSLPEKLENIYSSLSRDGGDESGTCISLSELIIPKVVGSIGGGELFDGATIPVVSGALWALQLGQSPREWRNSLASPVDTNELMTWIHAIYYLAVAINSAFGDGTAERLMYEADEVLREGFSF
ncbi:type II toxin-antitoxin system Phd/YefM family antitoxin [Streptomyces sp. NPDC001435]|uniref:type II toxin-antitoxin system Phd/YefM family antitoxin n=1 Tax=unclassified Streptomyces TaxID=2593676 RepID=UPI0036A22EC0